MKLTKPTLIEGRIVKEGSEVLIEEQGFNLDLILYHTSRGFDEIKPNDSYFGDSFFFVSDKPYFMGAVDYVYILDNRKDKYIDEGALQDEETQGVIIDMFKDYGLTISMDEAESLLDDRSSAYDYFEDGILAGEIGWTIQGLRGPASKNMGYDGVRGLDEQGTVYIIPMMNRVDDLLEVCNEKIDNLDNFTARDVNRLIYDEKLDIMEWKLRGAEYLKQKLEENFG